METKIIDLSKIVGIFTLCNTASVIVHKIDYGEDKVLASINGNDPEWCDITEGNMDGEGDLVSGFYLGSLFCPFSQVMRFYGGSE